MSYPHPGCAHPRPAWPSSLGSAGPQFLRDAEGGCVAKAQLLSGVAAGKPDLAKRHPFSECTCALPTRNGRWNETRLLTPLKAPLKTDSRPLPVTPEELGGASSAVGSRWQHAAADGSLSNEGAAPAASCASTGSGSAWLHAPAHAGRNSGRHSAFEQLIYARDRPSTGQRMRLCCLHPWES